MSLKQNEKIALLKLKKVLQQKYKLVDFRLFGSKATKKDAPSSDIDIMIELLEINPKIEIEIYKLIFNLNLEHDCFISAVLFSKEELEEGPLDESPLYKAIMKEGVIL